MKKVSNTIRIGVYRRGNLSANAKLAGSHPSSLTVQEPIKQQPVREPTNPQVQREPTIHQPVKQQQVTTENTRDAATEDPVHDQQDVPRLKSPDNAPAQEIDEENTNNEQQLQQENDLESIMSPSNIQPQQQLLSDSNEIPIKTSWSTRKKVLVGFLIATVIGAMIITGIVLAVLFTASSNTTTITTITATTATITTATTATTTTATTATTATTTIVPPIISIYWPFDGNLTDITGVYTGTISNAGTFTPAGSTSIPYVGYGQALSLIGTSSQQFSVPTPFLPLNSVNFTIEAWIYSTTLTGDRGIFGQCQCSTCQNQCFFLICRSNRLYVGFTLNDLSGVTIMAVNTWYHVAFVYNSQTQQQILYLNGVQDAISNNEPPYQGKNGSITIGSTQVYGTTNYFSGYIDNVMITTRAKSATEILRDASLVVYYSFDLPNPNADSGPNHLSGTSNNTVITTGRVNQAMRFIGFQSNFQAYGLYQVPYGVVVGKPFSFSMWINPTTTFSSTLVQTYTTTLNANWCGNLLGIYSPANIIGQLFVLSSNTGPSTITGPFVTPNTWSHVSLTYSVTNGYTLYFNGIYFGTTGTTAYGSLGTFAYLFVGYSTTCNVASINAGYQGSIDELYVHSRELAQSDVTALANP